MRTDAALLPFSLPLPPQLLLVIGSHAMSGKMLELVAALALKQPVTLLDCGNRSNMYAVARAIRPFTSDPVGVMNRIRLYRAHLLPRQYVEAVSAASARTAGHSDLPNLPGRRRELKDCQRLLTRRLPA